MGKPKQQVISRFFSPKTPSTSEPASSPSKPSPKISAVVSYSPAKRRALNLSPSLAASKKPKSDNHLQTQSPTSNDSLHQKFLAKFLDPPSDDSNSNSRPKNESSSELSYTPLEQQVVELKRKYPDVVLMVEVGYRYRFFGEDADVAARVLGIFAHVDRSFVTASVPTFRLDFHVRRLVGAGYKVGVVKQTETAAIKSHGSNKLGPFTRSLSSLYTKSTLESLDLQSNDSGNNSSNYILCIVEKQIAGEEKVRVGVLGVEVSTGFVVHGEFDDAGVRSALEAVVMSLQPVEVLLVGPVSAATEKVISSYAGPKSDIRIERKSRDCFKEGGALAEVMSLYEKNNNNNNNNNANYYAINNDYDDEIMEAKGNGGNSLHGIEGIMELPELVIQALALIIRYLKEFGLERIICFGSSFKPICNNFEMNLSANTLHQLEVLKNNSDGSSEGSLFQIMDNTCTSFGSRLFKQWLIRPLCDRNLITARLDAVSEILDSMTKSGISKTGNSNPDLNFVLSSVLTVLGKSIDVERGITRIFHRTAKPNEFIGVIQAILTAAKELEKLNNDKNTPVRSSLLRRLICTASSNSVISRAVKLLSCLNKDSAENNNNNNDMSDLFVLSNDKFPEVATGKINVEIAKEKLNSLISQYKRQLKMSNLEFKTISGTSHLIELDSDVKVPSTWSKISSTKKSTRYHPPEVLRALDDLLLAKEKFHLICRQTWSKFLSEFEQHYTHFKAVVESLAGFDCLYSLATLAKDKNYVRPVFCKYGEPREINIKSGRHPVLETILGDNFVPNDTNLNSDGEFCQIVTGPNMGGKSCYIRQVALISLMAQVGSFVPASSARLHVLDKILTRMGASDCMQKGRSTFFDELSETSQILQTCTASSLVIIDELGRGTSTHDGTAIAYETLKYLIRVKKCMVVFVTHYPKILDVVKELDGQVGAFRVSFVTNNYNKDNDDNKEFCEGMDVTFLYKVVRGASDKSFGLNVARLAQLPSKCIARAAIMAGKLEEELNERKNKEGKKDDILSENEKCEITSNLKISEEIFRDFLFKLRLAFGEADQSKILGYLKEARELALNVVK
ncbi:hypothetical protein LUZ60_012105 [Juncus effusus]|nr:hypothetical protein LUZ60_012105 [Juncus effusus]